MSWGHYVLGAFLLGSLYNIPRQPKQIIVSQNTFPECGTPLKLNDCPHELTLSPGMCFECCQLKMASWEISRTTKEWTFVETSGNIKDRCRQWQPFFPLKFQRRWVKFIKIRLNWAQDKLTLKTNGAHTYMRSSYCTCTHECHLQNEFASFPPSSSPLESAILEKKKHFSSIALHHRRICAADKRLLWLKSPWSLVNRRRLEK